MALNRGLPSKSPYHGTGSHPVESSTQHALGFEILEGAQRNHPSVSMWEKQGPEKRKDWGDHPPYSPTMAPPWASTASAGEERTEFWGSWKRDSQGEGPAGTDSVPRRLPLIMNSVAGPCPLPLLLCEPSPDLGSQRGRLWASPPSQTQS